MARSNPPKGRGAGAVAVAFALLGVLAAAGPSVAETPAAAAAPAAKPDDGARTKIALKLAGLVAFVANSCPKLKPDYPRFRAALGALGTNVEALEKPDMKAGYLAYTAQYRTDVKGNCEKAITQFGPDGKTIPKLFGPS